jgi:hypothetical protein
MVLQYKLGRVGIHRRLDLPYVIQCLFNAANNNNFNAQFFKTQVQYNSLSFQALILQRQILLNIPQNCWLCPRPHLKSLNFPPNLQSQRLVLRPSINDTKQCKVSASPPQNEILDSPLIARRIKLMKD